MLNRVCVLSWRCFGFPSYTFTPRARSTGSTAHILLVHPPSNLAFIHVLLSIPTSFLCAIYLAIPPSTSVLFFRFDHICHQCALLTPYIHPFLPPLPIPGPRPFHILPFHPRPSLPSLSFPSIPVLPILRPAVLIIAPLLLSPLFLSFVLSLPVIFGPRGIPAPGTRGEGSGCAQGGGLTKSLGSRSCTGMTHDESSSPHPGAGDWG
ncbi:hypothetical protein C8J57DRAFT_1540117 [Mycena rebaudengoi]|nr:hypothetical protein C8J57DRAFT_1540117 [Mycena rebaudengoi]